MENKIKTCTIDEATFKELMNGVKHCIAKDATRPILQYIKVSIRKDKAVFLALDGYRAGRVETVEFEAAEEFDFYIKPFSFKPTPQGISPVLIEYDGSTAAIEVATEYGKLKYAFKQPDENDIDIEAIYKQNRDHDRELAFNASYMKQACEALSHYDGRWHSVILETKESNISPFILRAGGDKKRGDLTKNEQLILPQRIFKEQGETE